jgi:hypothetical protein
MYWIVLFLTHVRMIPDRVMRDQLFRMALYHIWDLHRQVGGEAVPTMMQPLRAMICMWGVMLHTEYQIFLTTWALETNRVYDQHNCECAICKAPAGRLFPATQYWEVIKRAGIPTCLCRVCLARPHTTAQPPSAAAADPAQTNPAPAPATEPCPSTSGLQARAPQPSTWVRPPVMPDLIPAGHGRPTRPSYLRTRPAATRPLMPRPLMPRPVAEGLLPEYACVRSPDGMKLTLRTIKPDQKSAAEEDGE